ncbi:hypothetical protein CN327_29105 [Bacillus cereus]|nr:hypothetical protein CN509_28540 [Bacillus cereus]PET08518.1 hypothetical protein CN505_04720 [Bacillus cereus]PFF27617.1 hypothetical protein CN327_29105 [Bacillus cereus]
MKLISQEEFFKKYNLKLEHGDVERFNWDDLEKIYLHYIAHIRSLEATASTIAEILRSNKKVHSVRTRIKDPEHLIEKIIRKTKKKLPEIPTYEINLDNYTQEITDLIGIRVLHLYKDQAHDIDKTIRETWGLYEIPIIYYRKGDSQITLTATEEESFLDFQEKEHEFGYRSWHYLIKTKPTRIEHIAEIQVRTIFEEGWSEIDHQLRYPYELHNDLLREQLMVLNRLAGSADEMVDTIRKTTLRQYELIEQNHKSEQLIKELKQELERVLHISKIEGKEKKSLEEKIQKLEESQQKSIKIGTRGTQLTIDNMPLSPEIFLYSERGKIKANIEYSPSKITLDSEKGKIKPNIEYSPLK